MLRTTLAGLRLHKARYVTTTLAILLGVMFIAGTMVFSDSLKASYEKSVMGSASSVDTIATTESLEDQDGNWEDPVPFTQEQLDQVRDLPEVAEADGVRRGPGLLLDDEGRTFGMIPPEAMTVGEVTRFEVSEGELPDSYDEMVLATTISDPTGFEVGDSVTVLDSEQQEQEFTVTGLIDVGLDSELSYRGAFILTPEAYASVTGAEGYHEIDALAADGTSEEDVATAVAGVLGEGADVKTSTEFGNAKAAEAGANAEMIRTGLMLFALVAVFVAGIVIYNTFAILVAQRQREMALLRCVGAKRGQVFRSMLTESFVVGLVASILGLLAGIGLGMLGIRFGGPLMGEDLDLAVVVTPAAVIIGLVVGVSITVFSALVPALRATRVSPLAALSTSATAAGMEKGTGKLRAVMGILLFLFSGGIVTLGLQGDSNSAAMWIVAVGAIVAFLGVVVLGPLLVRGIVGLIGAPLRHVGVPSKLAVDNSTRSPRRAATAMIALTVGATLITGYSVINATMQETTSQQLDGKYPVDYQLSPMLNMEDEAAEGEGEEVASEDVGGTDLSTIPESVRSDLAARPEIDQVFASRSDYVDSADDRIADDDGTVPVSSYVDATVGEEVEVDVLGGDLADFGPGSVLISEDRGGSLEAGDSISLGDSEHEFEIAAVVASSGMFFGLTLDPEDYEQVVPEVTGDSAVMVLGNDSASSSELREAVYSTVDEYPTVSVTSMAEMRQQFDEILTTAFYAIAAMLGLAIIIAVFGISNTMALSVLERTRESAILRAMGLTKAQMRRMLGVEAVLLCLIGAGIGVLLGVVFGWAAISAALPDIVFGFPTGQVVTFLAIAVLAGVVSSLLPARRAARTSITGALASQ
ncbi:ABC transporter permease [Nocardiopsis sp. JB363]|uniref:ABC transporter permease n=1 Tax=Nocardiopsis sp. JB363 TaxID=1434837 RepID=UPI000979D380|nr:ABC transporter permease [Nocardiopsis sp. JB363]SIO90960.1 putative ABC transporter integral membrane protein [Nocardiopsis sp. JB363]